MTIIGSKGELLRQLELAMGQPNPAPMLRETIDALRHTHTAVWHDPQAVNAKQEGQR